MNAKAYSYIANIDNRLTQTTTTSSCANVTTHTANWFVSIVCIKFFEKGKMSTLRFTVTVGYHIP